LLTQSTQSTYKKSTKIYGTAGILWLVNKDKLVVAGFMPGSQAKQASVTRGDVLRKVDDKDVLQMKAQVTFSLFV